jgi:hypothetical protein
MEASGNQQVTTTDRYRAPSNTSHAVTGLDRPVNGTCQIGALIEGGGTPHETGNGDCPSKVYGGCGSAVQPKPLNARFTPRQSPSQRSDGDCGSRQV